MLIENVENDETYKGTASIVNNVSKEVARDTSKKAANSIKNEVIRESKLISVSTKKAASNLLGISGTGRDTKNNVFSGKSIINKGSLVGIDNKLSNIHLNTNVKSVTDTGIKIVTGVKNTGARTFSGIGKSKDFIRRLKIHDVVKADNMGAELAKNIGQAAIVRVINSIVTLVGNIVKKATQIIYKALCAVLGPVTVLLLPVMIICFVGGAAAVVSEFKDDMDSAVAVAIESDYVNSDNQVYYVSESEMEARNRIIEKARQYEGKQYSSPTIFHTIYYGSPYKEIGGVKYPHVEQWCGIFAWSVYHLCGYEGVFLQNSNVISSGRLYDEACNRNRLVSPENAHPGDLVIFNGYNSSNIYYEHFHIGIFVSYNPETKMISTIDGNTHNGDNKYGVWEMERKISRVSAIYAIDFTGFIEENNESGDLGTTMEE